MWNLLLSDIVAGNNVGKETGMQVENKFGIFPH